jgi:hypothetical protein
LLDAKDSYTFEHSLLELADTLTGLDVQHTCSCNCAGLVLNFIVLVFAGQSK